MNPVRNKKSEIFVDMPKAGWISNGMKALIGTPIHQCKDYCMEQWLENVSKLLAQTPADLLLVDNSPGLDYIEKVKGYCKKYGVVDYKIEHLEIPQGKGVSKEEIDEEIHERVTKSREIIRKEILSKDKNYDAWFSWECDQIIPINALDELINVMKSGDFEAVVHNCRGGPDNDYNFDFDVALIKKNILEKYEFLPKFGTSDVPENWYYAERWYKERLKKDECKYAEVCGLIDPIYHLYNR